MVVPEPVAGEQSQGSVAALLKPSPRLQGQQQQKQEELGLQEAQEVEAGLEAGA
jgi:hypothetical protein